MVGLKVPSPLEIRSMFPNIAVKHFKVLSSLMIVCTFNYTKPFSIDHDWVSVKMLDVNCNKLKLTIIVSLCTRKEPAT